MSAYWDERITDTIANLTTKSEEETNKQLQKYYVSASKKVIQQFTDTLDKIAKTVGEGRLPTPADLYKLDKYWQAQNECRKELQKLGDKTIDKLSANFTAHYNTVYNALALKDDSGMFSVVNHRNAEQMINQIWCADGKSWSQRIWGNTAKLQETLNEQLLHCVTTGASSGDLKKMLMQQFGVSYNRASTLVRTELAHIETQSARDRYEDYGIDEIEIIVEPDACPECQEFEGMTFSIHDEMPIPAHCNCRCCISPIIKMGKSVKSA